MYYLQSETSFDAAHFLKGYEGKCKNIHGHRWRVVARVQGASVTCGGSEDGMLMDFGTLKADLAALAAPFDHALLLETGSLRPQTVAALQEEEFHLEFLPFRTTAENLARYFYDRLATRGYEVKDVCVYETPTNCASYDGKTGGDTIAAL